MKLLKYILFGNFWSFLLVLSSIVDIAIGFMILTGIISVKDHALTAFIICLVIGLIYLAAGLTIAIVKCSKQTD
jgi:hypothetical protein